MEQGFEKFHPTTHVIGLCDEAKPSAGTKGPKCYDPGFVGSIRFTKTKNHSRFKANRALTRRSERAEHDGGQQSERRQKRDNIETQWMGHGLNLLPLGEPDLSLSLGFGNPALHKG